MELTYHNILDELKKAIPELYEHPNYDEIAPNYSGNLPYVVFSYLQLFFKECFKEKQTSLLEKISHFLEEASSSKDDKVIKLIMFGFMEELYGNHEDFHKDMLDYFGPKTKKVLVETVEHNAQIGIENKDQIYKLFDGKL